MRISNLALTFLFLFAIIFVLSACRTKNTTIQQVNTAVPTIVTSVDPLQKKQIEKLAYNYFDSIDNYNLLSFVNMIAKETIIENIEIFDRFQMDRSHVRVKQIKSVVCLDEVNGPCELKIDLIVTYGAYNEPMVYEDTRLIIIKSDEKWVVLVPY